MKVKLTKDSHSMIILNISSKATGPIITKFHVEPSGAEGAKTGSDRSGHMTDVATTPIYGKKI